MATVVKGHLEGLVSANELYIISVTGYIYR